MKKEEQIKNSNYHLIEQGDLDAVERFFTANYVAHAGEKEYFGHDFIKRFVKQIRTALPDISVTSIEILVNASNKIVWQRTLQIGRASWWEKV